jgi:ACS family glucarate transporter-like MFS transporter
LSQSSFWSVTADLAGASAGSVSGFMNMGNQIGAALTASLTPWIAARFGWTTSFLVAAALCLVGAVSWLFVDPSRQLRVSLADAGAVQIQSSKYLADQPVNRSPMARATVGEDLV